MPQNIVVTTSNKRAFRVEDHYRQTLNRKIVKVLYNMFVGGGIWQNLPDNTASYVSNIYRISFASDVSTAANTGGFIETVSSATATNNSAYQWFAGNLRSYSDQGRIASSNIYRIAFSTYENIASSRGKLTEARHSMSGTGTLDDGWFIGGSANNTLVAGAVSNIQRLSYSNDTGTATNRGNLIVTRQGSSTSGNFNVSYISGGIRTSNPNNDTAEYTSLVERLTYANDTSTISISGYPTRAYDAAHGNTQISWFAGGGTSFTTILSSAAVSSSFRIEYANDTAALNTRGPLTVARFALAAHGNLTDAWFAGGNNGTNGGGDFLSRVDRITFANDAVTASARGNLGNTLAHVAA